MELVAINETVYDIPQSLISPQTLAYFASPQYLATFAVSLIFFTIRSIRPRLAKSFNHPARIIIVTLGFLSIMFIVISSFTDLKTKDRLFIAIYLYELTVRVYQEKFQILPRYHMGSVDGCYLWAATLGTVDDDIIDVFVSHILERTIISIFMHSRRI